MALGDWVAKKLEKQILTQPNMTKTEAYEHMKVKYNTHLNMKKVINALEKAKKSREGSEKEQFGNIRLYLSELLRSNHGSTCGLQVVPQAVHKLHRCSTRMYICLDARKKGFKVRCEAIHWIGWLFLEGILWRAVIESLWGRCKQALLCNCLSLWLIVKQKTIGNGFDLLEEDLGDHVVYGWNFISDQQKGLLPALKEVMPRAHHRFCVQHVWKNFMKQWRDKQLRALLWECARCTTIPKFERTMRSESFE
ncbi:hypothetical protein K1719_043180 [Acacia pycnantha]|nr:hypothetical protein K1719_043180 [Acacia pycnantha]